MVLINWMQILFSAKLVKCILKIWLTPISLWVLSLKRNIYLRTQREKNELFISNLNFLGYTPKKQKEYQRILIKIHNHWIIGDEFNLSSFFILIELKENSGTIFGKLLKKGIIIKPGKT